MFAGRWVFPRALLAGLLAGVLATIGLAEDAAAPSVQKLTEQLASRDLSVRREAAWHLWHMGAAAKPALPALIKALDDDDKQVWSSAATAIAALGPEASEAVPALLDHLDGRKNRGRQRDVRQAAMRTAYALSRMGPSVIPPLIAALGENDVSLRTGAARALSDIGPAAHEAVPALVHQLGDSQDSARDEAVAALAAIGPTAAQALITGLHDADARRRGGAALALAQLEPPFREKAAEVAEVAARETDATVRAALLGALPKTGVAADKCVSLIVPAVIDDNDALRHAALNALLSSTATRDAAVPRLKDLLQDKDPAIRERAARALGRIGPAAAGALPALLAATRASDGAPAYAQALADVGPKALPSLLETLQKSTPGESAWILRVLHTFGPPAVPVLLDALKSANADVRAAAAGTLGEMGRDASEAAPALFGLTKDVHPAVQAACFRALVAVHGDSARLKPLLEAGLNSADPQVRQAAAAGLAGIGATASLGVDGLVNLLGDQNPAGRLAAVQALGQLGVKASTAVPALLDHLEDAALQSAIMEALAQIGPAAEPAIPRLLVLAKKPDQRATILPVLAGIGHGASAALPMIYGALNDDSPDVRASAVTALAAVETDDAKALAVLVPIVSNPQSGKIRRAVAHALAKYGPAAAPAVPGLIAMLQKETDRGEAMRALKSIGVRQVPDLVAMLAVRDQRVRAFACESLGTLGAEAKEAAPKLREIAAEDGTVRDAAQAALKKIEP